MSQASESKFKNTIVGGWVTGPEATSNPTPSPSSEPAPSNGGSREPVSLWPSSPPSSTALARIPKVLVLDELALPQAPDERLVLLREPESARSRSYRLLRHRLLTESDPRVIVMTSAEPGEGKTTCALNLALALAEETMARVLLVEANLRRPALAEVFGFEPTDSFMARMAERRDATPPYAVAAIFGTRLQVAALPPRLAADVRLDRLLLAVALNELREVYDYVIIDAAAVLESADADVVAECADGVVMTLRAGKSRRRVVRRALEQVRPVNVLGSVLIDV